MDPSSRIGAVPVFILKFALFASVCLPLWWLVVPYYSWVLGQVVGFFAIHVSGLPIQSMNVESDGILGTHTVLTFVTASGEMSSEIGRLVNNVPPFVLLVFATPGLALKRRVKVLAAGIGILVMTHIGFVTVAFAFAESVAGHQELAVAFGKFLVTLPFILWIVLAYWERLATLLNEESGLPPAARQED